MIHVCIVNSRICKQLWPIMSSVFSSSCCFYWREPLWCVISQMRDYWPAVTPRFLSLVVTVKMSSTSIWLWSINEAHTNTRAHTESCICHLRDTVQQPAELVTWSFCLFQTCCSRVLKWLQPHSWACWWSATVKWLGQQSSSCRTNQYTQRMKGWQSPASNSQSVAVESSIQQICSPPN